MQPFPLRRPSFFLHGLIVCALAAAETSPGAEALPAAPRAAEPLPKPLAPNLKSQGAAYGWTLGATAIPITVGSVLATTGGDESQAVLGGLLIATGMFVGPSAGQFYAGSTRAGLGALSIRLAGAGLVVIGAMQAYDDCLFSESSCGSGAVEAFTGIALFTGGVLYSLIDTKFAVDRANARAAGVRVGFLPALLPTGNGRYAPGFRVSTAF